MKDFFNLDTEEESFIELVIPKDLVEYQGKLILDLVDELEIKIKEVFIENKELHCVIDEKFRNKVEFMQYLVKKQVSKIKSLERSNEWNKSTKQRQ